MKISGVSAVTLAASPLKHFQSESHFTLDDIKNSNLSLQSLFCQTFGSEENIMNQPEVWNLPRGLNISARFHVFKMVKRCRGTEVDKTNISWQGGPLGLNEQYWDHFSSELKL